MEQTFYIFLHQSPPAYSFQLLLLWFMYKCVCSDMLAFLNVLFSLFWHTAASKYSLLSIKLVRVYIGCIDESFNNNITMKTLHSDIQKGSSHQYSTLLKMCLFLFSVMFLYSLHFYWWKIIHITYLSPHPNIHTYTDNNKDTQSIWWT